MNSSSEIFTSALSLPVEQRAALARQLIDSLPESAAPAGASDEELHQRLSEIAAGEFQASDWREALANMRARSAELVSKDAVGMNVRVLSGVHRESVRIAQYYERQQSGLAAKFFDALKSALEKLEANPLGHPRWESITTERNIRRIVLDRFPYLLIFEILSDEAIVIALRHASQEPSLSPKPP